ncbi:hypothetical protein BGZ65_005501 [Modicella reniformis]|uniref:MD-2-related lipid-recognition domain-containing protein n=1 Tax=Modicella reniformis TaxID=1440133 RepID=A0A9P6JHU8_9FUNG|nr:hypothetical protein BGZ65_005501 [Modicella reniformis]
MKLFSSLALVAALFISSSAAADLDTCPGNERLFDLYNAKFSTDINPQREICIEIKGELKTDVPLQGSMIEYTVAGPADIKKTWQIGVYSTMRYPSGTELPFKKGTRTLQTCFYLPPEFKDTKSGTELAFNVKITSQDKDGDDVRVLCVRGNARVA